MPSLSTADSVVTGSSVNSVPLLDLDRQHTPLREQIVAAMAQVFDSGRFVLGPDCTQLDHSLTELCGATAISCASGSDALLLALMACDITAGDEVIVPSFTFFATASAVARLGAKPVFIDIDPETYNLDPKLIESLITPATKAIIPVHLYGQCADMDAIMAVAQKHNLAVIEDAAQAIGAEYHGKPAGSIGDVGCLSFYPTKNLGGGGDGGALVSRRPDLVAKLQLLRVHGMEPRYYHQVIGINSRLDSLQAAILNVKLPHLSSWSNLRAENAAYYSQLITQAGLTDHIGLPKQQPECKHVWNQYIVRVRNGQRDALRQYLAENKIGTEIYYPLPLHYQECFAYLGYQPGSLPESEKAALESLALPIFPGLREAEQAYVVEKIAEFFAGQ